jgi:hypothetical protein
MPHSEEYSSDFEEIISGLGSLVGENEIEARKALGDERYEKTVAYFETANVLMLKKEAAQVKFLESNSFMLSSFGFFSLIATILGIVWSFYFWLK